MRPSIHTAAGTTAASASHATHRGLPLQQYAMQVPSSAHYAVNPAAHNATNFVPFRAASWSDASLAMHLTDRHSSMRSSTDRGDSMGYISSSSIQTTKSGASVPWSGSMSSNSLAGQLQSQLSAAQPGLHHTNSAALRTDGFMGTAPKPWQQSAFMPSQKPTSAQITSIGRNVTSFGRDSSASSGASLSLAGHLHSRSNQQQRGV
jgi:hypothetical protein